MRKHATRATVLLLALSYAADGRAEWVASPAAVQTIYQSGVPHTDRTGRAMAQFDRDRSFFPIVLYHALHGEVRGQTYDLAEYAKAGFNAVHLWERLKLADLADVAAGAKLQLIIHWPDDTEVARFRDHPAVLAWYLDEEPTGTYWDRDMAARFDQFVARREQIRKLDPHHPVFALDVPWITPPATEWWVKWSTAGDVSAHDNYPINQNRQSLSFDQGIPETVSLAVRSNDQKKPVWVCLPAFEQNGERFQFSMPSPRQMRCMTYASIVHGATGIMQFALDSWVTRNGNVIGVAPNPQADYGQDLVATAEQLQSSRALWDMSTRVNRELEQLRPALLSPTAKIEYQAYLESAWPFVTKTPIRTLLKTDPSGGYVLLVVNIDAAPQRARILFPGMTYDAEQMFESKGAGQFKIENDGISLLMGPYDVRIVRIGQR